MFKKGDTLIEVTIAIGIFSLVAIAVASVMNGSTSDAQLALEATITREEIDAQAEALRFIHDSYATNKENPTHPMYQLWQEIASHAIKADELGDNTDALLQYSPTSCSNILENRLLKDNAFAINTRKLNEGTDAFIPYSPELFLPPSTNPRLVFGGSEGAALYDSNVNKDVSSVEGLYVFAVVPESEEFYDFYIRTCWYGGSTSDPSTLSTVIRLYNSDQLSFKNLYFFTANLHHMPLPSSDKIEIGRTKKIELKDYVKKREDYTLVGWCTEYTDNEKCSGEVIGARETFYSPKIGQHYDLYAMWKLNTYNLSVRFIGSGITSVKVCTVPGNCSGSNLKGTITSSGGRVSGLPRGSKYYLYPTFAANYVVSNWEKNSSAGTLSSTSATNPVFEMGAGDGTVTLTSKITIYPLTIKFAGSGVSSVKVCTVSGNCSGSNLKGTVSSSGGKVNGLSYGATYYLYPIFATGYGLSSWAKNSSTGTLSSTSALNPTFRADTGDGTVTVTGKINNYTCTKRYRLQNADGSYPGYTTESTSSMAYNSTCSYSKSASYYSSRSGSCKITTSGCTISLDLPRTTYSLTVNRNTSYLGSTSGSGTYRWGQNVSISATPSSGSFTYWTISSGASGSFANSLSRSTTYTMPKGNSTVYANAFPGYIQNMNASLCSRVASSGAYDVIDSRDGNSYKVRYLNGRCWTLDNLRLDLSTSRARSIMSSSNTNASDKALSCLLGRNNYSCNGPYARQRVTNNGDNYWSSSSSSRRGRPFIHVHLYDKPTIGFGAGSAKRGVFYDICAASAGSVCNEGYYSDSTIPYDICPSGWQIPTGSMYNSLISVYTPYRNATDTSSLQYNLSTPLSGLFDSDGHEYIEEYGFFWSSTIYRNHYYDYDEGIIALRVRRSNVNIVEVGGRRGVPVRCVTK